MDKEKQFEIAERYSRGKMELWLCYVRDLMLLGIEIAKEWNEIISDSDKPIDCEPNRIMLQYAQSALAAIEDMDMDALNYWYSKMISVENSNSPDG